MVRGEASADEGIPGGLRVTDRWLAAEAGSGRRTKKRRGVKGGKKGEKDPHPSCGAELFPFAFVFGQSH